jgi:hypothetical protein
VYRGTLKIAASPEEEAATVEVAVKHLNRNGLQARHTNSALRTLFQVVSLWLSVCKCLSVIFRGTRSG